MTFEAAGEELSKEEIVTVLQEVFARGKDAHIAYAEVKEGRRVFGKEAFAKMELAVWRPGLAVVKAAAERVSPDTAITTNSIAFNQVNELKKNNRVEMTDQVEFKNVDQVEFRTNDRVEIADQKREIDAVTQKESKRREIGVFTRKENKEIIASNFKGAVGPGILAMNDEEKEENNSVKKAEDSSVGDVEKKAYVFARKENKERVENSSEKVCVSPGKYSKDIIEDNLVKGCEEARILIKDKVKEIFVFTCKESEEEAGRVEKAGPEVIESEETVEVEQRIANNDFGQVKKLFRSEEQYFEGLENVDEEILLDLKEEKGREQEETVGWQKQRVRLLEDCSTVGVREDNDVYSQDGDAVKSDIVREAPREEILVAKDIVKKMEKTTAAKETFTKFKTAGVVEGRVNQVVEKNKNELKKKEWSPFSFKQAPVSFQDEKRCNGNLVKYQSKVKKPLLFESANEKKEKLDNVEPCTNLASFSFVETIKDKEEAKANNNSSFASFTFVKPEDVKTEEVGPECIETSSEDVKIVINDTLKLIEEADDTKAGSPAKSKHEKEAHLLVKDYSTVGVPECSNPCSRGGEAAKSSAVQKAYREGFLRVKDVSEKMGLFEKVTGTVEIGEKSVKLRSAKSDLAGVVKRGISEADERKFKDEYGKNGQVKDEEVKLFVGMSFVKELAVMESVVMPREPPKIAAMDIEKDIENVCLGPEPQARAEGSLPELRVQLTPKTVPVTSFRFDITKQHVVTDFRYEKPIRKVPDGAPLTETDDSGKRTAERQEPVVKMEEAMEKISSQVKMLEALPTYAILSRDEVTTVRARLEHNWISFQEVYFENLSRTTEAEWQQMLECHEKAQQKVERVKKLIISLEERKEKLRLKEIHQVKGASGKGTIGPVIPKVVSGVPTAVRAMRPKDMKACILSEAERITFNRARIKRSTQETVAMSTQSQVPGKETIHVKPSTETAIKDQKGCQLGVLCDQGEACRQSHEDLWEEIRTGRRERREATRTFTPREEVIFREKERVWSVHVRELVRALTNMACPLLQFPDEILLSMMSHMTAPEISSLAQTSMRFSRLAMEESLWKRICACDFPEVTNIIEEDDNSWKTNPWKTKPEPRKIPTWRELYVTSYRNKKNREWVAEQEATYQAYKASKSDLPKL